MNPAATELAMPTGMIVRSAIACLVGTFVLRMAAGAMGNMLNLYFAHINATEYPLSFTLRGIANAIFFLPELFGSPILGSWSDRYGRKLFIMIGPITGAVAVQLTALTSNFGVLAFTRLLEGLSTASAIPATLGYLSAITSKDEALRGRVMGVFEVATIGGSLAGILIGGPLWDALNRSAFMVDSAIYLLSLAIFFFGMTQARSSLPRPHVNLLDGLGDELHAAANTMRQTWRSIRESISTPKILRFIPAWLAINMILGAWLNTATGQLLEANNRFPDQLVYGLFSASARAGTQVSISAAVVFGIFGLGVVLWSFSLGRIGRTTVMLISALGLYVLCGFLFALNHAGSLDNPLIPVYGIAALVALMVVSGFTPAAVTYLADLTDEDPGDRGAIMGVYTVLFGMGQFVGTLIAGPFVDARGMDALIILTLALGLLSTYVLIRLHRGEAATAH